ncbi:hypothetical protein FIBSPDRAFT_887698 [Athelia psychrophila]|uniref:G domain-containing protein n=1 Tax=Athelia psychrophila TaxID=1759441 RepID=A0A166PFK1_9AGAM|nr:hypothetical protein FIBSPDRAFT_887698 [Fibularhizoctonia sp. CBS 109695]
MTNRGKKNRQKKAKTQDPSIANASNDMNNLPDNIETRPSLRLRCPYFRILVMGRSNAGKTTILKKVCNSVDDPLIFGSSGKQIDASVVAPSAERGYHDINNEMVFKSNPNFIFHDSRGFECGSVDETETVQRFLSKRASATELKDQLHAVWYCLPTDTARPILAADETFFNGCGIGKDMQRGNTTCSELIEATANAITDDALKGLFVSVQQSNIEVCIRYALQISNPVCTGDSATESLTLLALIYFPHVWRNAETLSNPNRLLMTDDIPTDCLSQQAIDGGGTLDIDTFQIKNRDSISEILGGKVMAFLGPGHRDRRLALNVLTAILLCMEQTFTQASAWGDGLPKAFSAALDVYVASGHILKIQDAITTILSGKKLSDYLDKEMDSKSHLRAGTGCFTRWRGSVQGLRVTECIVSYHVRAEMVGKWRGCGF